MISKYESMANPQTLGLVPPDVVTDPVPGAVPTTAPVFMLVNGQLVPAAPGTTITPAAPGIGLGVAPGAEGLGAQFDAGEGVTIKDMVTGQVIDAVVTSEGIKEGDNSVSPVGIANAVPVPSAIENSTNPILQENQVIPIVTDIRSLATNAGAIAPVIGETSQVTMETEKKVNGTAEQNGHNDDSFGDETMETESSDCIPSGDGIIRMEMDSLELSIAAKSQKLADYQESDC